MLPHSGVVIAGIVVWAVAIAAALIYGRPPERTAGLALGAELMLSFLTWGEPLNGYYWPTFLGDIICSLVFIVLASRTARNWIRWAAPLQLLSTATFCTKFIDPAVKGYAYLLVEQVFGFAVIGLLLWGVFFEAPIRGREWMK